MRPRGPAEVADDMPRRLHTQVGDTLLSLDGSPCQGKSVSQCIDASLTNHLIVVLPIPTPRPRCRPSKS